MEELIRKEVLHDEEDRELHDAAEEEVTAKIIDTTRKKEALISDQLVDHSNERGRWEFKVRWYGLASKDDI